jgi:hypothetical protein
MSDLRPRGYDSGFFKGKFTEAGHVFDRLDPLVGTPLEFKFALWGLGWGTWVDPLAAWYFNESQRKGLLFSSWFFPYAHLTPKVQVDAWLKAPRSSHFPVFVDYERSKRFGTIPSASHLLECFDRLEQATGEAAGGYSRKELIDKHLATMSTDDLNMRWWWLAQYVHNRAVEDTREIILPSRLKRERVLFHQTADKGAPPPGFTPNAKSMDWDRWVGPMPIEQFAHSPNPPAKSIEQRLTALEALHQPGGVHP